MSTVRPIYSRLDDEQVFPATIESTVMMMTKKTMMPTNLDRRTIAKYVKSDQAMIAGVGLEETTHAFIHHDDMCAAHFGRCCNCEPVTLIYLPPHVPR